MGEQEARLRAVRRAADGNVNRFIRLLWKEETANGVAPEGAAGY